MPTLRVDHAVRDFDAWKRAFDSDPVGRKAGGVRKHRIAVLAGDPNHVVIDLEFDSAAEADAFAEKLRRMWVEAGPRLGLESPSATVLETVETHTY